MSTLTNGLRASTLLVLCGWHAAVAQTRLDPRSTLHITLPDDSPVTVLSADWGESTATARGGAMLLDLHTSLTLRNSAGRSIRGITLLVQAQDVTPGGRASVSVPSLNVGSGDNFPVRIDLRLLRPLQAANGPLVEISLDGVLFDDMSFYGPNRLNSRRSMTVWEMEARRDRQHFKQILESRGRDALRQEMLASLDRQADRRDLDIRVAQKVGGRSTATRDERQVALAFLHVPSAPVTADAGSVRIASDEARSPQITLRNRSGQPVRGIEMSWLVKDARGREFAAGSTPIDVNLGPRSVATVIQDTTFRFSQPGGGPVPIGELTAHLTSVEFTSGQVWVPGRSSRWPTPSPEEQRLAELYRKRGIEALVTELNRF
ncbi:MAG TPA: hypothetical protein VES20_24960 [Bryobacteraceae bacterium]|nr:hypothetical protein [Bryobacteraceae bacterium]